MRNVVTDLLHEVIEYHASSCARNYVLDWRDLREFFVNIAATKMDLEDLPLAECIAEFIRLQNEEGLWVHTNTYMPCPWDYAPAFGNREAYLAVARLILALPK